MKATRILIISLALFTLAKTAQTVADTWQIVLVNLENFNDPPVDQTRHED